MNKIIRFFTISIIFQLSISSFLFAQSERVKMGDREYRKMRYAVAIDIYEGILESADSATTIDVQKKLADCYLKINNTNKAEKLFREITKTIKNDSIICIQFAETLAKNGLYYEARFWYNEYSKLTKNDARPQKFLERFDFENEIYADSSDYKIYYLGFNTNQTDFSPTPYDTGIVFCSARKEGFGINRVYARDNSAYLDLYFCDTARMVKIKFNTLLGADDKDTSSNSYGNLSDKKDLHSDETRVTSNDTKTLGTNGYNLKDAKLYINVKDTSTTRFSKKLNTKYHEGPACFRGDSVIYFSRNNYNNGRARKSEDGINKLKIFGSRKKDGKWSKPTELSFCSNNYSVGHPALSPDGNTMYFVSDMVGTLGKTDLFKVTRDSSGKWSDPINMGDIINSEGDEMFPFVDQNNTLYFSSNGHGGLGGLDVFMINLDEIKKGNLKNVGFPISSKKDDFGFIINSKGTSGFLSSNRKRGGPDDDIYFFKRQENKPVKMNLIVKSDVDSMPIWGARVEMKVTEFPIVKKDTTTTNEGAFTYNFKKRDERNVDYMVTMSKAGYISDSIIVPKSIFTEAKKGAFEIVVYLKKIKYLEYCGSVLDKKSKKPIEGATIFVFNTNSKALDTTKADASGLFCKRLTPGASYVIKAEKENYFPDCYTIEMPKIKTITRAESDYQLTMTKIGLNTTFEVKNLLYDYNAANVREDAAKILDNVVDILREFPTIKVELGAHTDARGKDEYNKKLSQKRADSAVAYIVKHGIAKIRITSKGYGESKLLNKCKNNIKCTEEEHAVNRRTEIKVTGFLKPSEYAAAGITDVKEEGMKFDVNKQYPECPIVKVKIKEEL